MYVYEGPSMGWLIFKWIMILMLFSLLVWLFVIICVYEKVNVYEEYQTPHYEEVQTVTTVTH
jgi:uncharacterized membrane protein